MRTIHSFAPIGDSNSIILILGSMPGRMSLEYGQYYAHPRNVFWKIMHDLTAIDRTQPYDTRTAGLRQKRIAVWDVLKACTREGSLDSAIDESSIVPNDFASFLADHPAITSIFFNGAKADNAYRKHIWQTLPDRSKGLEYQRLPSTSPANAAMPYPEKLARWEVIIQEPKSFY